MQSEERTEIRTIELVIATCPKPFIKEFDAIQQNAIKSWMNANHPNVFTSIYLMGNEEGVQDIAKKFDCYHVPNIEYNTYGTPLVNGIFYRLREISQRLEADVDNTTLVVCCYINSDIIIFDDMLSNIYSFVTSNIYDRKLPYLLVGKRCDVDGISYIDFSSASWAADMKRIALEKGEDHGYGGIDYFIFSPVTFKHIYPFALGKFVWDQWLVGNVYRRDSITVDISNTNLILHQNSPWYQKSTGGCTTDRKSLYETEEVKNNESYDYYRKDIYAGTRFEATTSSDTGKIKYTAKQMGTSIISK